MAVAWCINAYDCSWNLIRTLEQLQSSNIGVWVQYTAPNPLDDKKIDYIKYTDKCGCTCTLSWENEILIYSTNWVIKNLSLTNDDTNERVIVKWTDLFGSNRLKTVVRYKTWSYPSSPTDWTLAVEETTQNQYQTNWYWVSWLTDWTTYYFSVFALDWDGTTINVQSMSITTNFVKFKLITDFRNYSSLAQLQAVWRTNEFRVGSWWTISIGYWNTWLKLYNTWYWWIYATLPFAINWNNKIHWRLTWNWNSNSAVYMNLTVNTLPDLSYNDSKELVARLPFANRQWLWLSCSKSVWNTKYWSVFTIWDNNTYWVNWDFIIEFDVDLTTSSAKYKIISPNSLAREYNWTLNTDWRNIIIWTKYLMLWFANYNSATNYIYTSELIIK